MVNNSFVCRCGSLWRPPTADVIRANGIAKQPVEATYPGGIESRMDDARRGELGAKREKELHQHLPPDREATQALQDRSDVAKPPLTTNPPPGHSDSHPDGPHKGPGSEFFSGGFVMRVWMVCMHVHMWDGPHEGPDGPHAGSDVLDGVRPIQAVWTLMRTIRTTISCTSREVANPNKALPALGAGLELIIFPARAACAQPNIQTKTVWCQSLVS